MSQEDPPAKPKEGRRGLGGRFFLARIGWPSMMQNMQTGIRTALACAGVIVTLAATGCSSHGRAWNRTIKEPTPVHALTGAWEGRWISDVNGHNERLRCLVTHQSNEVYQAWFHARWKAKLFTLSATYKVDLIAKVTNGVYEFSGEADLGALKGGRYRCEGRADGTRFVSTYRSEYDHGTFNMARPAPQAK